MISAIGEGVPHASWSEQNKLKEEGTVEGEQKTGREGRQENLGTGTKVFRGPVA